MTSSTPQDYLSLRQRALQRQIFDALTEEDSQEVNFLQAQWVHRYGLDTLLQEEEIFNLFRKETSDSCSIEPEERTELNETFEEFEQIELEDTGIESISEIKEENTELNETFEEFEQIELEDTGIESVSEIKEEIEYEQSTSEEVVNCKKDEYSLDRSFDEVDEELLDCKDKESNADLKDPNDIEELNKKLKPYELKKPENSKEVIGSEELNEGKEIVNAPPPPPPTLNNLRKWLN